MVKLWQNKANITVIQNFCNENTVLIKYHVYIQNIWNNDIVTQILALNWKYLQCNANNSEKLDYIAKVEKLLAYISSTVRKQKYSNIKRIFNGNVGNSGQYIGNEKKWHNVFFFLLGYYFRIQGSYFIIFLKFNFDYFGFN